MTITDEVRTADRRDVLELRADALAERHPWLPPAHRRLWSDEPVIAPDGERRWLVSPLERDPTLGRGGPKVLPAEQRRTLRRWMLDGPHLDAVAVAHELDPDEPLCSALLAESDGRARPVDDATARALVGPAPAHPAVSRIIGLLDRLGSRRGSGWVADALLDPLLFGIVAPPRPEHGAPALWYVVDAWRW